MSASFTLHPQDAHFLDIFTHDIRSPLLGVSGCLSELEHVIAVMPDNDEPKADLAHIKDGLARVEAMLNGLMTISRRSRPETIIEDIDMNTVLAEAVGLVQAASGPLDVEVMPLPPCRADRASMVEVFVHLLRNAVRAGSPVTVSGQRGARLRYTVTDQGRGLSESMKRRCFEMFTTDGPGDGIGLSLARHHVIRQRGWLRLRNLDNGGCQAEVSLPPQAFAPNPEEIS